SRISVMPDAPLRPPRSQRLLDRCRVHAIDGQIQKQHNSAVMRRPVVSGRSADDDDGLPVGMGEPDGEHLALVAWGDFGLGLLRRNGGAAAKFLPEGSHSLTAEWERLRIRVQVPEPSDSPHCLFANLERYRSPRLP